MPKKHFFRFLRVSKSWYGLCRSANPILWPPQKLERIRGKFDPSVRWGKLFNQPLIRRLWRFYGVQDQKHRFLSIRLFVSDRCPDRALLYTLFRPPLGLDVQRDCHFDSLVKFDKLFLSSVYQATGRFLRSRSLFPRGLRFLSISRCPSFDDRGCEAIASHAPALESLNLDRCHAITPIGFRELEKLSGLRHLMIDDCGQFNATNAFPLSLTFLVVSIC